MVVNSWFPSHVFSPQTRFACHAGDGSRFELALSIPWPPHLELSLSRQQPPSPAPSICTAPLHLALNRCARTPQRGLVSSARNTKPNGSAEASMSSSGVRAGPLPKQGEHRSGPQHDGRGKGGVKGTEVDLSRDTTDGGEVQHEEALLLDDGTGSGGPTQDDTEFERLIAEQELHSTSSGARSTVPSLKGGGRLVKRGEGDSDEGGIDFSRVSRGAKRSKRPHRVSPFPRRSKSVSIVEVPDGSDSGSDSTHEAL